MSNPREPRAVLFDLDGTLVDSAPDLLGALAWLRDQHGLKPLEYSGLRHHASRGALGIINAGFQDRPDLDRERLRKDFLERYEQNLWIDSHPFEGIEDLLRVLCDRGLGLGVVTNKLEYLAKPLVAAAGWQDVFDCIVGGDTAPNPKPHPAPVLEACRRLGIHPSQAMMVGDDIRDIESGQRSGCITVAATWGYVAPGEDPSQWHADHLVDDPQKMNNLIIKNNYV
ncbi:MAG TPA: HAD-IA family hydrolase [Wenzhouxiangella sp.]|nr:HAD-IA family hydrolase [Wenzhouxiangella sp.]